MSDLISRRRAISILEQLDEHSLTGKMDILNAIYLLENQPTAYDVDKVIDELQSDVKRWEDSGKEYNNKCEIAVARGLRNAIEIVKQGGVSDDCCEWKLEDKEANLYSTGCQQRQLIFDGTPKENGYRYCPYCGKKIKVVE